MLIEYASGLALFAFASSATPGPNNMMLLASGANFGVARSVPHMLGVGLGFLFLMALVGAGLAQVFDRVPMLYPTLQAVAVVYLLYLAWRIARAADTTRQAQPTAPLSFLQAAAFQWVNPKAWTMALTAVTVYAPDTTWPTLGIVLAIFGAVNLPCVTAWTALGQQIARVLHTRARLVLFNRGMALLLVASLVPLMLA